MTDRGANEQPDVLSVGVVLGGTASVDDTWRPEIQRVMRDVATLREGVSSPLSVNVVFHVDGDLLPSVDFEGVRAGTFRRRGAHLMVQAAVPVALVDHKHSVLIDLLRAAIAEAEVYARRRRVADDLHELRRLVDAMPDD